MRFVQEKQSAEPFFQSDQVAQRRAIAIHGKHSFRDDDNFSIRVLATRPLEMALELAEMIVRKHADCRAT